MPNSTTARCCPCRRCPTRAERLAGRRRNPAGRLESCPPRCWSSCSTCSQKSRSESYRHVLQASIRSRCRARSPESCSGLAGPFRRAGPTAEQSGSLIRFYVPAAVDKSKGCSVHTCVGSSGLSVNLYPTCRSVTMCSGRPLRSNRRRRRLMSASTLRVSTKVSRPQTIESSVVQSNTTPARAAGDRYSWNRASVNLSSRPSMCTRRLAGLMSSRDLTMEGGVTDATAGC